MREKGWRKSGNGRFDNETECGRRRRREEGISSVDEEKERERKGLFDNKEDGVEGRGDSERREEGKERQKNRETGRMKDKQRICEVDTKTQE